MSVGAVRAPIQELTITQLARRQQCAHVAMRRLMQEEQAHGHVRIVGDVVFSTQLLEERFGPALRGMQPGAEDSRSARLAPRTAHGGAHLG